MLNYVFFGIQVAQMPPKVNGKKSYRTICKEKETRRRKHCEAGRKYYSTMTAEQKESKLAREREAYHKRKQLRKEEEERAKREEEERARKEEEATAKKDQANRDPLKQERAREMSRLRSARYRARVSFILYSVVIVVLIIVYQHT